MLAIAVAFSIAIEFACLLKAEPSSDAGSAPFIALIRRGAVSVVAPGYGLGSTLRVVATGVSWCHGIAAEHRSLGQTCECSIDPGLRPGIGDRLDLFEECFDPDVVRCVQLQDLGVVQ